MLLIFDLDDTLINTSEVTTPFRLKEALIAMQAHGLNIPSLNDAYTLVQRLSSYASSSKEALQEFAELMEAPAEVVSVGLKTLYEEFCSATPVKPMEGAFEVLNILSKNHDLAIVTMGKPKIQREKIEKAGFEFSSFYKLIVTEERNKKIHYRDLMQSLKKKPSEVLVCGDRIALDLEPAKQLGMHTIRILHGRGLTCHGKVNTVDYSVSKLQEIPDIIEKIQKI